MWNVLRGLCHIMTITTVLLTIKTEVIDYQLALVAALRPDYLVHEFSVLGATLIKVIVFRFRPLSL